MLVQRLRRWHNIKILLGQLRICVILWLVLSVILAALVVIIILISAERYGTNIKRHHKYLWTSFQGHYIVNLNHM